MARIPPAPRAAEIPFMREVMLALGSLSNLRIHRQNCGQVPIRDRTGKIIRTFDPGPPNGAADISGIVGPEGWRLEVEIKADDGDQSDEQKRWQRMIEAFGGIYVLVEYDAVLSQPENIAAAVATVLAAIHRRRTVAAA